MELLLRLSLVLAAVLCAGLRRSKGEYISTEMPPSESTEDNDSLFRSVKLVSMLCSIGLLVICIVAAFGLHMLCYAKENKKVRVILSEKRRKSTSSCTTV